MILGTALIIGALSLFLYNRQQTLQAEQASSNLMPQLLAIIEEKEESDAEPDTYEQPLGTPIEFLDPKAFEMTEVEINGHAYIGYLSIPQLMDIQVVTILEVS